MTYSLTGRLLPGVGGFPNDPEAFGRLYSPIGYWNGLAGLRHGIDNRHRRATASQRAIITTTSAASTVILGAVFYLTLSRGGIFALTLGLVSLALLGPRPLRTVLTAIYLLPSAAVAIILIEQSPQLTAALLEEDRGRSCGEHLLPLLILLRSFALRSPVGV